MDIWLSEHRTRNMIVAALLVATIGFFAFGDWHFVWDKGMRYLLTRQNIIFTQNTGIYLIGIALVLLIEIPLLGWPQSSVYRLCHPSKSTIVDIVCFVIGILKIGGIGILIFSLGLADLALKLIDPVVPRGILSVSNPLLQMIWLLVAIDFCKYWIHVIQHKWKVWWELHKFHHAAEEFNVITTSRDHPTDEAALAVALAVPFALLGGKADQFLLLSVLFAMHAGLTHSMLPWKFGWIGRWILVSPIGHRIHHSAIPEQFDKNYGMVFIFWDRIFGTYYNGALVNPTVTVSDNVYNKRSIFWDIIECPRRMLRAVFRRNLAGPAEKSANPAATSA